MARHRSPDTPFTVLFVCTGNICRSALAERLARAYLDDRLGDAADQVVLHSAGTSAVVGSGVHPASALVLSGFGGTPAGFAARQLVGDHAVDADLVLALTRTHRRIVLKHAPRTLNRTFTLTEAADLLRFVDGAALSGDSFAARGRSLVAALAGARGRRSTGDADDIRDPIGQELAVHQEVGEAIAAALVPLLDRLLAPEPS